MREQVTSAVARIKGNGITGTVHFSQRCDGVLVVAHICGLPESQTGFFAFHIHEGGDCEHFGPHFDLCGRPHPNHTGDLPPLLSCRGRAYLSVMTDRFRVADVVGRVVVIHAGPDDFHTQPSGNPGEMIACGEIVG